MPQALENELLDACANPIRGKERAAPIRTRCDGIALLLLVFLPAGMPSSEY
jgi:hypothetical protein